MVASRPDYSSYLPIECFAFAKLCMQGREGQEVYEVGGTCTLSLDAGDDVPFL